MEYPFWLTRVHSRPVGKFFERQIWVDEAPTRHYHALIFSPTHEFNEETKEWLPSLKTLKLSIQAIELFIRPPTEKKEKEDIYYAGTYVLHRLEYVTSELPAGVVSSTSAFLHIY